MRTQNVLRWRPKSATAAPAVGDPALLWTMRKDDRKIECILQDYGRGGWTIRVMLDGLTFYRSRFRSWEDAIESAEDRYADLVRGGWTPVPLSHEDRYGPA